MIQYRRILELYFREVTQRTICASVGHSRYTVSEVILKAKELGMVQLTEEMDDQWFVVVK